MKKLILAITFLLGVSAPAYALDAGAGSGSGSGVTGPTGPIAGLTFDAAPSPRDAAAATAPAVSPTPTQDAPLAPDSPSFLTRIWSLWRSGAGVPVAILLLFGAAVALRRRFSWFAEDHRAAYTAAAIAGLGKIADIAATGQTPNQNAILGAFAGLWLLFIKAAPGPAPEKKTPAPIVPSTPAPAETPPTDPPAAA